MPTELTILSAVALVQLAACIGMKMYAQYIDMRNRDKEFEIKLAMADAQSKSASVKDFDELIKTLDFSISFYCINESLYVNRQKMTEEELNLLIVETAATVTTNVVGNLAEEFLRQLKLYVSEDWLEYYVTKSAIIKITARIENSRS